MVRSNEGEPATLADLITSRLNSASAPRPTPPTACRLVGGRGQPTRSARTHHPRSRDGMRPDLLTVCRELAAGRRPWPLYLWSPGPGTGKTSAALVMLDHYGPVRRDTYSPEVADLMNGFADFVSLPELLRGAERGRYYGSNPHACETLWASSLWAWMKTANLLVLDDLRRPGDREHRLGDDHYSLLKRVLDERVSRPLIVTSNLSPWERPDGEASDLVRVFDDRIADRIVCGTVFKLDGWTRRGE